MIDVLDIETGKTGRVTQILQLPRSDTKKKKKKNRKSINMKIASLCVVSLFVRETLKTGDSSSGDEKKKRK